MTDLFIHSEAGKVPIENKIVRKYKLEKGSITPFTRQKMEGENGEAPAETSMVKDARNHTSLQKNRGEEAENVLMSTSEIIDFAQGTDSDTGQ